MQVIVIMQLIRYEIYYPENIEELSFVENSQTRTESYIFIHELQEYMIQK